TGGTRPTIEYRYTGAQGPSSSTAVLHKELSAQRLAAVVLPAYLSGGSAAERVHLDYDATTGRVASVKEALVSPWNLTFPDQSGTAAPATTARVEAPWGHVVTFTLVKGRLSAQRETVPVSGGDGTPQPQEVATSFSYAE